MGATVGRGLLTSFYRLEKSALRTEITKGESWNRSGPGFPFSFLDSSSREGLAFFLVVAV